MSRQGTAYWAVKKALVTLLSARPGLQGVVVGYAAPERVPELRATTGSWCNIHFAGATGSISNVVFCDGRLTFDHEYTQTCRLQVLNPRSLGTQEAVEERLEELTWEIFDELAGQAAWDLEALGLDWLDRLTITPAPTTYEPGRLEGTEGHAIGLELGLLVEARTSP